jgi:hypothetical protein
MFRAKQNCVQQHPIQHGNPTLSSNELPTAQWKHQHE